MAYQTRRETRAPSQKKRLLYEARDGEIVVESARQGLHLFRHDQGERVEVALNKGEPTLIHPALTPISRDLWVSESTRGVLPERQLLVVPRHE